MKKLILALSLLISCSAFAGAKEVLQSRLNKVESFYAHFSQIVKTTEKDIIQEGEGELWVKRPSYFNWTMRSPDETTIISDSKDLWFYTPAVEQVTVMRLAQAVDNQLLLFITDSKNVVWDDYQVQQKNNSFTLTSANNSTNTLILGVLPTGMLSDFSIIESDGQRSDYVLSHQALGDVDMQHFQFTIPQSVTVDDQR